MTNEDGERMRILWDLFWTFARIGVCTFGGGLAMLPMLQLEVVNKHHWATEEELLDYYAIGQCTPGIIAVNTATFIGYRQAGVLGGILATLGVVFPSFVIISIIAGILTTFAENIWVQHAFAGIRVAVAAMVVNTVIKMWHDTVKNKLGAIVAVIAFVCSLFLPISPIAVVLLGAALGLVLPGLQKGVDEK